MARRSKYKFNTLNIGETIQVEGIDVYSLSNSLAGYNKRNHTSIEYARIGEADRFGKYTFKRTA